MGGIVGGGMVGGGEIVDGGMVGGGVIVDGGIVGGGMVGMVNVGTVRLGGGIVGGGGMVGMVNGGMVGGGTVGNVGNSGKSGNPGIDVGESAGDPPGNVAGTAVVLFGGRVLGGAVCAPAEDTVTQ